MPQLVNKRADVRVAVGSRRRHHRYGEFRIIPLSGLAGIHHGFRVPEITERENAAGKLERDPDRTRRVRGKRVVRQIVTEALRFHFAGTRKRLRTKRNDKNEKYLGGNIGKRT